MVFLCVQWLEVRGDCLFCWCLWSCWPSIFIHKTNILVIVLRRILHTWCNTHVHVLYMLYSVNANFELTNANNVILIQIDDIFAEKSMYMYVKIFVQWKQSFQRWQSFNTDSNLWYFCRKIYGCRNRFWLKLRIAKIKYTAKKIHRFGRKSRNLALVKKTLIR
jgi:hypothetical protein